jgi:hypothetical protein
MVMLPEPRVLQARGKEADPLLTAINDPYLNVPNSCCETSPERHSNRTMAVARGALSPATNAVFLPADLGSQLAIP